MTNKTPPRWRIVKHRHTGEFEVHEFRTVPDLQNGWSSAVKSVYLPVAKRLASKEAAEAWLRREVPGDTVVWEGDDVPQA